MNKTANETVAAQMSEWIKSKGGKSVFICNAQDGQDRITFGTETGRRVLKIDYNQSSEPIKMVVGDWDTKKSCTVGDVLVLTMDIPRPERAMLLDCAINGHNLNMLKFDPKQEEAISGGVVRNEDQLTGGVQADRPRKVRTCRPEGVIQHENVRLPDGTSVRVTYIAQDNLVWLQCPSCRGFGTVSRANKKCFSCNQLEAEHPESKSRTLGWMTIQRFVTFRDGRWNHEGFDSSNRFMLQKRQWCEAVMALGLDQ